MTGVITSLRWTARNNGSLLWNISVDGAIGKSSPVIYNDTVFIVSEQKALDGIRKKTKVTAVNLDDGSIRWTVSLRKNFIYPSAQLHLLLGSNDPCNRKWHPLCDLT